MLESFRKAKEGEIAALLELDRAGAMPPSRKEARPGFAASLKALPGAAVIAEYKRASPSGGDINLGASPLETAIAYAGAGAGAISVLTEERYFKGSLDFLESMAPVGLPLLRKDFIFHPLQVDATAATPASAMLVIVRMLDTAMLDAVLSRCRTFGLEAVVEVFDEMDLFRARDAGAEIIQVNNRNLATLEVDLAVSGKLAAYKDPSEFWITASGISSADGLNRLLDLGFDAALVGSSLMAGENPGAALAGLLRGGGHA